MKPVPLPTRAAAPRDAPALPAGASHKLRGYLNRIVTSCELLKIDVELAGPSELVVLFDQVRADAIRLGREFPAVYSVPDNGSGGGGWREFPTIGKVANTIPLRIQEIRRIAKGNPQLHIEEELLDLELAVHHLAKLIEQTTAAVSPSRSSARGGSAETADGLGTAQDHPLRLSDGHPAESAKPTVLIADDDELNRDLLARLLRPEKHDLLFAASGDEVLQMIESTRVDLVLLDLLMPGASGFEVLRATKAGPNASNIPVIIISGVDEVEKVALCIETGADDYVLKPFNATLLRARVRALLERKQALDLERQRSEEVRAALLQLEAERETTERLLLNVLPRAACEELRACGSVSPTYFEDVTIVFTDFVGFTASTEKLTADELVALLNEYFTAFDNIVDRYGLEKLKTVGDSYIFLSGLPDRTSSHPVDAVLASMEMLQFVTAAQEKRPQPGWAMRIGIHTGSVIAGVVGTRKFAFDVWGDAVNFASRMVSSGAANKINVSERTFQRVKDFFSCIPRGLVEIKGNRRVEMHFVEGVVPSLLENESPGQPSAFFERYHRYFRREPLSLPPGLQVSSRQP